MLSFSNSRSLIAEAGRLLMTQKAIVDSWKADLDGRVAGEAELRHLREALEAAAAASAAARRPPPKKPYRAPTLARAAELAHRAGARVGWGEYGGGEEDRMLSLATPEELEAGLRRLHQALCAAQTAGDAEGVERARLAARRCRRHALQMAANAKLRPQLRAQKQEMADWLLLWLEMPSAFFDWLELRKKR